MSNVSYLLNTVVFVGMLTLSLMQRKNDAELRDCVINGLSYLLFANPEIGLKHFLPLGYDPDEKIRGIFCHVAASAIAAGVRFEASSDTASAGKRMRIAEVCATCYQWLSQYTNYPILVVEGV